MGSLKKYYFGKTKAIPNTFIGGVSATINTPALLATQLQISVNRIKGFKIVGSDIQCNISGSYPIGQSAFVNRTTLTYYNDPTGLVTGIGNQTFNGCTGLASINLPNLTSITGSLNFYNCTSLVSVSFPNLVSCTATNIFNASGIQSFSAPNWILNSTNVGVFYLCTNLSTLTIGKPTYLPINAFVNTNITSIDLSDCTTVGANALSGCTQLFYINNLNKVTEVHNRAFYNCQKMPNFSAYLLELVADQGFRGCVALTDLILPKLTTVTGTFNFNETSIVNFSAPLLTQIGTYIFYSTLSLVKFEAPLLRLNNTNAFIFSNCTNLSTLTIGKPTGIGQSAFSGTKISYIDLSECLAIEQQAFTTCRSLASIENLNAVTRIERQAFQACSALVSVTANSLETLEDQVFNFCDIMTSVTMNNLKTINGSFSIRGTRITNFNFPSLTTINGDNTFYGSTFMNTFSAPLLTKLGSSVGDNGIFTLVKSGATVTVSATLQTVNSGNPDGDLLYVQNNRGGTIVYV